MTARNAAPAARTKSAENKTFILRPIGLFLTHPLNLPHGPGGTGAQSASAEIESGFEADTTQLPTTPRRRTPHQFQERLFVQPRLASHECQAPRGSVTSGIRAPKRASRGCATEMVLGNSDDCHCRIDLGTWNRICGNHRLELENRFGWSHGDIHPVQNAFREVGPPL
jgi:hypothetical protein